MQHSNMVRDAVAGTQEYLVGHVTNDVLNENTTDPTTSE